MRGLYIERFFFRDGSCERIQVRALSAKYADQKASKLFKEKYNRAAINERGGVASITIRECNIRSEGVKKYL